MQPQREAVPVVSGRRGASLRGGWGGSRSAHFLSSVLLLSRSCSGTAPIVDPCANACMHTVCTLRPPPHARIVQSKQHARARRIIPSCMHSVFASHASRPQA